MTPFRNLFNQTPDDQPLIISRSDLSGGMNNRQDEEAIGENQATVLYNVDLDVPGEVSRRPGLTLAEDLGNDPGLCVFGYEPAGGTNLLVAVHGAKVETYTGSGTFTERKTDLTSGKPTTIVKIGESGEGDVFVVGNHTDNWFRFEPDDLSTQQDLGATAGTGSDSPPKSGSATIPPVACWYRNRFWILDGTLLYFSDAYSADYSTAFDTVTNAFRIPVGEERALVPIRDAGIIVLGSDYVYGINPSVIPEPTTDKAEKMLDIGCASGPTACQVGDDVLFLAPDGVRGVFRTQQDKLQLGVSYPLSYMLKTQFEDINWSQIHHACAVYWDNKYFISLPTGTSTYNDQVWVYWPSTRAWAVIDGWNVARFATVTISGEQMLYCIDSVDGKVYRAWYGTSDNGTAIALQIEGRAENGKQPHLNKIGGELIVRAKGGSGTITVFVNPDNEGYSQLGTLSLAVSGVTFPTAFPITFSNLNETRETWHLGTIEKWKKLKWKIYCNTLDAVVTVLETMLITYPEEFQFEAV